MDMVNLINLTGTHKRASLLNIILDFLVSLILELFNTYSNAWHTTRGSHTRRLCAFTAKTEEFNVHVRLSCF